MRCLLEQGQYALLRLVGLGQHGCGGLRDDLRAGQLGGGLGKIGVLHPAAGGRGVGGYIGQVISRISQAVDRGTLILKFNTSGTQVVDFIGNRCPIADYKAGLVRFSGVGSANSKAANSDF